MGKYFVLGFWPERKTDHVDCYPHFFKEPLNSSDSLSEGNYFHTIIFLSVGK